MTESMKEKVYKICLELAAKVDEGSGSLIICDLVEAAACYWAGREDDFCLQSTHGFALVFGGTNRLIWSAKNGFVPDRGYCTQGFLDNYDKIGKLPWTPSDIGKLPWTPSDDAVRFEVKMDRKTFNQIKSAAMVRQMSGNAYGLLDAFIVKFVAKVDEGSAGYFFSTEKKL